jgi:hypothetical protein
MPKKETNWKEIAIDAKAEAIYNARRTDCIKKHPTRSHEMPYYEDLDEDEKKEYRGMAIAEITEKMKEIEFKIPITYTQNTMMYVKAKTIEEAINKALDKAQEQGISTGNNYANPRNFKLCIPDMSVKTITDEVTFTDKEMKETIEKMKLEYEDGVIGR